MLELDPIRSVECIKTREKSGERLKGRTAGLFRSLKCFTVSSCVLAGTPGTFFLYLVHLDQKG